MKTFALIAIGVSALALTACVRPSNSKEPLKPLARLDCPESQGRFQRAAVAADGKSCDYTGADGAKLQLKLVSFSGDADTVLSPIETQMKTMLPAPPPPASASAPPPPPTDKDKDNVDIDLPGISIHADNGKAKVNVAGVHVDANDQTNSVRVNGGHGAGQFTVDANDNGAVIRTHSFSTPNFEESWIWASKEAGPDGWRSVGYEAIGPKAGPLVIASFQSKADEHDSLFDDVKTLARKAARAGS